MLSIDQKVFSANPASPAPNPSVSESSLVADPGRVAAIDALVEAQKLRPTKTPNRAPIAELDFVQTAIGKLYAPEGVRKKFSISLAVLDELVQQGFIPHYRVRGFDLPLFSMPEVRKWIADNLVEHYSGAALPAPKIVVQSEVNRAAIGLAPVSISSVPGLRVYDPAFLTGVYFLCKGNEVVYVGQSTNIGNRVTAHVGSKSYDKVFFLRVPASQLVEVESRFIASLKPVHNKVGKKAAA